MEIFLKSRQSPVSNLQSPISNPYLRALYLSYNKLCLLVKSMG